MSADADSLDRNIDALCSAPYRWYVIRTLPRLEALAEVNLHRSGVTVFVPKIAKTIRHARKMETRNVQLFPGYGFVGLDLASQGWRAVNGTVGVAHLVMAHERPLPVPLGIVEEFLDCSDENGVVDLSRGLTIGGEVRMRSGPFVGAMGLLSELDNKGRVEVLLQIMNGTIRIKTAQDMLEPCQGAVAARR
ncbi:transcription termination/antitermination protein NusG [Xanthobacter aminoxidans]|uniref:transcription termination/antitermination protein NusG n=1 Tax=Xanthobacter aminoxidans TaxID=186280 RepID=UPI0037279C42